MPLPFRLGLPAGGFGLGDLYKRFAYPQPLPQPIAFEGGMQQPGKPVAPVAPAAPPMPFEGDLGGQVKPMAGAGGMADFMRRMQALRMAGAMRERLQPRPY